MKFVTYNYNGTEYVGVLTNDETYVIPASEFGLKAGSMLELIKELDGSYPAIPTQAKSIALSAVKLEAPIPEPRQDVICLGLNYRDHVEEATRADAVFDVQRGDAVYFSSDFSARSRPEIRSTDILTFAIAWTTKSSLALSSAGTQRTSKLPTQASISLATLS